MKIYLSYPFDINHSIPLYEALEKISNDLNITIYRADYFDIEKQIAPQIIEVIKKSDVFIADLTYENRNVYYEIGLAHAFEKPVILVGRKGTYNHFSLHSYRFYQYESIIQLSFILKEILLDSYKLNQLKPLAKKKHILDFDDSTNDNRLNEILNLSGVAKFYELEKWIYSLLKEIPGFEVQYNEQRSGKEYDFIVWNSNEAEELNALGNPIPIEVKASNYIENTLLHSLISKASSQGFKSFILITTANLTERNKKLIRDLKVHSDIAILVIDREDLREISSSKDVIKALIKSFRKSFIY